MDRKVITVALIIFLTGLSTAYGFDYRFCNDSNQKVEVSVTPGGAALHRCDKEAQRTFTINAKSYYDLAWPYAICNIKDGIITVNGNKIHSHKVQSGHRMIGRKGDTVQLTLEERAATNGSVKQLWHAHETAYLAPWYSSPCPKAAKS